MPPMLDCVVCDERSWVGGDLRRTELAVKLSDAALAEVARLAGEFASRYDATVDDLALRWRALALRELSAEIDDIRAERLDANVGLAVVERILPSELTDLAGWPGEDMEDDGADTPRWCLHKQMLKVALVIVSHQLGRTLVQSEDGRLVHVKEVRDRGLAYGVGRAEAVHYSDTADGGDYHTDGAEIPVLPKYLPFLCVRQAKQGGCTLVKSVYAVHNRLLAERPAELARLYAPFYWDRRGTAVGGDRTFRKPVFRYERGQLLFTYLRKYIEDGHALEGAALTDADRAALDALDESLCDESLYARLQLEPGQLLLSNNFATVHGRPRAGFRDSRTDPRAKRLFLRTWVARPGEGGA